MGYVPPRPQAPGESDEDYIAYLEGRLDRQLIANLLMIPGCVGLALVVLVLFGATR